MKIRNTSQIKRIISNAIKALTIVALGNFTQATAQGLHFSQFYNAPMIQNAANTGLLSDYDYRVGANYRSQWSSIPAPYKSYNAYADFQAFRSNNMDVSWLGIGIALSNDVAGNGNLSNTTPQLSAAYHVQINNTSMLSGGFTAAYVQRSLDFSKLTWDMQWDGAVYNTTNDNGEKNSGLAKTAYFTVGAGLNLAFFPNENTYVKFGVGANNLNQPKETFIGGSNTIAHRYTGNLEALVKTSDVVTINPSINYVMQRNASELVYGMLFSALVGGEPRTGEHFLIGAYHRWNDAVIAAMGFDFSGFRIMASYDVTISSLSPYNNGQGAFELGLRWQGMYNAFSKHENMNCPRF